MGRAGFRCFEGDGEVKIIDAKARCITAAIPALMLSACGSPEVPSYSVKVADAYPPAVVNIEVTVNSPDRDGRLIEAAAQAIKGMGTAIEAGQPPIPQPFKRITFTVVAPKVGQIDSIVGPKIIHLTYDAQALRDLAKGNADADAILAGAQESGWWTPTNDDVIRDYCVSHATGQFCASSGVSQG